MSKSINRLRNILLCTLVLGCNYKDCSKVSLQINTEYNLKSNEICLHLSFYSDWEQNFLFDRKVFSFDSPQFEDNINLLSAKDFTNILDSLKYPQVIVENKRNEKRFFSDIRYFSGEEIQGKSEFNIQPNYDTIKIVPNDTVKIKSRLININRLKNRITDDSIRVVYMFKPTKVQFEQGYKAVVVKSNWFSLKNEK